jgi:glycosyltransferase involved in cell wall biosynthesis
MRDRLEGLAIPVKIIEKETQLNDIARNFGANVLHGHTCSGGSYATVASTIMKEAGYSTIGGETLHSACGPGVNQLSDFEVALTDALAQRRPRSTFIQFAVDTRRLQVTEDRESFRARYNIPKDAFVIGRNGRLVGSKLPGVFIDVLARIPSIYGMLCGDGELKNDLKHYAEQLGCIDRLAFVEEDFNIGNRLNAMDLFVYPTQDELVCAVVIEAMAFGLPVVAYGREGIYDVIKDGLTGMLAYDVDTLTAHVISLIENDTLRMSIADAGRNFVEKGGYTDLDRMVVEHEELYERCLNTLKSS